MLPSRSRDLTLFRQNSRVFCIGRLGSKRQRIAQDDGALTFRTFPATLGKVREISSIVALIALLLSFAGAPFSHLHTLNLDHSATSGLLHQHEKFASQPDSDSQMTSQTADDDAVNVGWNVAPPTAAQLILYAEVEEKLEVPSPSISRWTAFEQDCHLSDAPTISPRQDRAPPSA